MTHALTRNRTYDMLAAGHYGNIRTYKRAQHLKLRDGQPLPFVLVRLALAITRATSEKGVRLA